MDNCYSKSNRMPREQMHNQDERLANKHIQTLAFLQEMANENKTLKQRVEELEKEQEKCKELHALAEDSQGRIQEIQEQYLKRADEINQMLSEQHRMEMMQVLDDKMEMERTLKEEVLKLRREIESLQRTNVELRDEGEWAEEKMSFEKRISELQQELAKAQSEVEDLTQAKNKLQECLASAQTVQSSEIHQMQELRQVNQSLTDELQAATQKNVENTHMIEQLQKRLTENESSAEQTKLIEALRHKMEKLMKQKELAVLHEEAARKECAAANSLIDNLQETITRLEEEKAKVMHEYGQLTVEFEKLRRKLEQDKDKAGFRDFVALKRELIAVKNENEVLRLKARSASGSLPMLKEDLPPPKPPAALTKKGKKKLLAITLAHGTGKSEAD
ncbi:hypothetical protein BaRGS_00009910 [Batillaria attramentaria]|uniref:Uncharacterized protein n=1 Tax=Batillaria attramentaria TaxID=370345 RepID=A0ABD0LHD2_9CAEN